MEFIVRDVNRINGSVWQRVEIPRNLSHADWWYMQQWCRDLFGPFGREAADAPQWSISVDGRSNLFFKNPEDVTLFLLRWT